MIKVVAYQARTATSQKTQKPYTYQIIEIQQSPERPNAQFRRFYKNEADALAPGVYTAKVSFYSKGQALAQSFYDFKPTK